MLMPTPGGLRTAARYVESDVFNICNRIKEIDSRLQLVLQENHAQPWVVMEHCADGETRFVKRYEELTPQVLDDLRHMLTVPFEQRVAALQKKADEANDVAKKLRETEAWHEFMWDFKTTMYECGLTHDHAYKSFTNTGKRRKRGGA
jgi:hypothetical protein